MQQNSEPLERTAGSRVSKESVGTEKKHERPDDSRDVCDAGSADSNGAAESALELWTTSLDRQVIAWQLGAATEAGPLSITPQREWVGTGAVITALATGQVRLHAIHGVLVCGLSSLASVQHARFC